MKNINFKIKKIIFSIFLCAIFTQNCFGASSVIVSPRTETVTYDNNSTANNTNTEETVTNNNIDTSQLLGFVADEHGYIFYFYKDGAGIHIPAKFVKKIDDSYYYFNDLYRLVKPDDDGVYLQINGTNFYSNNYGKLFYLSRDNQYVPVTDGILKEGDDIVSNYFENSNATANTNVYDVGTEQGVKDNGPVIREYKTIVVAGDSYARNFYHDEKDRDFNLIEYARAGMTLEENKELMHNAFNNSNKVILLSVGVNENNKNSSPQLFERNLRQLCDVTRKIDKIVFVHSYMHYVGEISLESLYKVEDYDSIIRRVASEYENVYFIDVSDLGMGYLLSDGIHYSKAFNDILYERMIWKLAEIVIQRFPNM